MDGVTEKWLSLKWTEQRKNRFILLHGNYGILCICVHGGIAGHLCTYGMIHELLEAIENRICFALHFLIHLKFRLIFALHTKHIINVGNDRMNG